MEFINGQEAYSELSEENPLPDLVFLDINMPVMDGFEYLDKVSALRSEEKRLDDLKVVMFSTSREYEEKKRAMGFDFVIGYLEKMPTADQVKEYLDQVI